MLIKKKCAKQSNYLNFFFRICAAISLILSFTTLHSISQIKPTNEYQLKAAFIFNFTRFVDWPANSSSSLDDPFVIGVLGDDRFSTYINEIVRGEKLGSKAITVKHFKNVKELAHCNILFISAVEASKIKDELKGINRRGVLTVSDAANFVKWGGIISFFKEENKLRLQINTDEAKASQLTISSKLLNVSKIYSTN